MTRNTESTIQNDSALGDLRVIDLTSEHGAYCGKLLAELGADVVKVEPLDGDPARQIAPFLGDEPGSENSLFFLFMNTGKRSIALDASAPAGKDILHGLIDTADLLVEDLDGEHVRALGLEYETLSGRNAGIVVTSITPFGRTGPYRDFVASDLTIMGMAGALYNYGMPHKPPNRLPGHQATILAGIHGAIGALTALYVRDLTSKGQHVDVSMQDAISTVSLTEVLAFDRAGRVTKRSGMRRIYPATGVYRCADGYSSWVCGGVHWKALIEWMNAEGMAEDLPQPEWRETIQEMTTNRGGRALVGVDEETRKQIIARYRHVEDVFSRFVESRTKAQILGGSMRYRIPVLPVLTAKEIADHEGLAARNFWVELPTGPNGKSIRYPGPPFRLTVTPPSLSRAAPRLGEHTREILSELGLTRERAVELREQGVIFEGRESDVAV